MKRKRAVIDEICKELPSKKLGEYKENLAKLVDEYNWWQFIALSLHE